LDTLLDTLHRYWGHTAFRPAQREAIEAATAGRDVLAILPTGGGKSLCYQLPALVEGRTTLVISPLVALMLDQVARLASIGIPAAALTGSHAEAVGKTLEAATRGAFRLLYCAPERLHSRAFLSALPYLPLSAVAVDEAHCISTWGHDFRPDYRAIPALWECIGRLPVMALTASATPAVAADIRTALRLREDALVLQESFERPNIFYRVEEPPVKATAVAEALRDADGSALVYCRTRRGAEALTKHLVAEGFSAAAYHAGLSPDARAEAQSAWTDGAVRTVVATTAFGMGIDKFDVRLVIHHDPPEDLEGFYQESGRAGRDGAASQSLMVYDRRDLRALESAAAKHFPPEAFLRRVYQAVAEHLQLPTGTEVRRRFPFDAAQFFKAFSLPAEEGRAALHLLEAEGLWTLSEDFFRQPTAQFLVDAAVYAGWARTAPELAVVATAILRLHGPAFDRPVAVSVRGLARYLRVRVPAVREALQRLHSAGILAWEEPVEGAALHVHHYRVDSQHLILNPDRLRTLRAAYDARTAAMLGFLTDGDTCRTARLLRYFGQEAADTCNHCDVCARKAAPSRSATSLQTLLLDALSRGPLQPADLTKAAPGSDRSAVVAALRRLIDEGLVIQTHNGLRRRG